MWTVKYKGYFIHGYSDREDCEVQRSTDSGAVDMLGNFRTLLGAKRAITRDIRSRT